MHQVLHVGNVYWRIKYVELNSSCRHENQVLYFQHYESSNVCGGLEVDFTTVCVNHTVLPAYDKCFSKE